MRPSASSLTLVGALFVAPLRAEPYAVPPDGQRDAYGCHRHSDGDYYSVAGCSDRPSRRQDLSAIRVHVGAVGRARTDSVTPGLLTAIDLGRGPAGFRASAAWLRVGSPEGIAQYTGEITLDLGEHSAWRPVLGAGAGLAQTYRVDAQGNRTSWGAALGVGLVRGALEYKLPVEGTDARAAVALLGVLPAIRGDAAPDDKGWFIFAATVGIGL